jgi:hypothetical protein
MAPGTATAQNTPSVDTTLATPHHQRRTSTVQEPATISRVPAQPASDDRETAAARLYHLYKSATTRSVHTQVSLTERVELNTLASTVRTIVYNIVVLRRSKSVSGWDWPRWLLELWLQ